MKCRESKGNIAESANQESETGSSTAYEDVITFEGNPLWGVVRDEPQSTDLLWVRQSTLVSENSSATDH